MSEAKNKMSLTERIRNRIGDSALYGGKTICDSPQNGLTTNNKKSSLRAASEDKGTTNSHKEIFELFAALTHKKNRIGRCLTSLRSGHDILCNTLCGAKRARAMTTNNKKSSLRAASEDKGTTNSHTRHPEEAESRREDLGTSVPFVQRLITALACGDAHALRAQHDNAWKIITTTKIMNITFNGGYNA